MKGDRRVDVRVEALVNRAVAGGALEALTHLLLQANRHRDLGAERVDAARVGHHLLLHGNLDACQVEPVLLRLDAEDGGDAGAEGGGHEVGGREGTALAVVVFGGVGGEGDAGRRVLGFALQVAEVVGVNFDHGKS